LRAFSGPLIRESTGHVHETLQPPGAAFYASVPAGTAIPGILPVVQRDGLTLVDDGNLGHGQAQPLRRSWYCALATPARSPARRRALRVTVQSLSLLIQQRLITDVAYFAERVDLNGLPPLRALAVPPTDGRAA
jgi:NTE family protein